MKSFEDRVIERIQEPIAIAQEIVTILSRTSQYSARVALKLAEDLLEFRRLTDMDRENKELDKERYRDLQELHDSLSDVKKVLDIDKAQ